MRTYCSQIFSHTAIAGDFTGVRYGPHGCGVSFRTIDNRASRAHVVLAEVAVIAEPILVILE